MTRHRSPPHLATLVLLTGLTVLSLNMFLPSLPVITREFGASKEVMGMAVSAAGFAGATMVAGGAGLTAAAVWMLGDVPNAGTAAHRDAGQRGGVAGLRAAGGAS